MKSKLIVICTLNIGDDRLKRPTVLLIGETSFPQVPQVGWTIDAPTLDDDPAHFAAGKGHDEFLQESLIQDVDWITVRDVKMVSEKRGSSIPYVYGEANIDSPAAWVCAVERMDWLTDGKTRIYLPTDFRVEGIVAPRFGAITSLALHDPAISAIAEMLNE